MTQAWTGGQYSLFRTVFGGYLFLHFVQLASYGAERFPHVGALADPATSPFYPIFPNPLFLCDTPAVVLGLIALGIFASLAFALGFRDRIAALVVWLVWACLFTRDPLISNHGTPFVAWLLLAHAAIPALPYGSWDARGRNDPNSDWTMPNSIYVIAWILMGVGYTYSGATKLLSPSWLEGTALFDLLNSPLARPTLLREAMLSMPESGGAIVTWGALGVQLLFAPLALIRRLRPWLWLTLLVMQFALVALVDFPDLSAGMIFVHFFTFNPAWIAPRVPTSTLDDHSDAVAMGPTIVFYDGACGLCHRTVRFLLAEDSDGRRFRFAPLDSDLFIETCAVEGSGFEDGTTIPDSVLVHRPGRPLLVRTEGVLELGHQLGGLWRIGATIAGWLPLPLLNAGYDFIARVRHRLFTRPEDSCPLLPPDLRDRFSP
ncbi:MAG: DCC1-like thiol-disulfide oxidoreductase family protein [Myxococcales bacterium]